MHISKYMRIYLDISDYYPTLCSVQARLWHFAYRTFGILHKKSVLLRISAK